MRLRLDEIPGGALSGRFSSARRKAGQSRRPIAGDSCPDHCWCSFSLHAGKFDTVDSALFVGGRLLIQLRQDGKLKLASRVADTPQAANHRAGWVRES